LLEVDDASGVKEQMSSYLDSPRSLRDKGEIARRTAMLHEPHIETLTAFVANLRAANPVDMYYPNFDPLDGGVNADILFLFEKPGPKTSPEHGGSGFISQDNDDPTAEATFKFMRSGNLPRQRTLIWNVIPGWNGKRGIGAQEWREGVVALKGLVAILPVLRTMVLVGRKAERARSLLQDMPIRLLLSAHPSPVVRASRRTQWETIPTIWAQAAVPDVIRHVISAPSVPP
jgi:hypothetical protein